MSVAEIVRKLLLTQNVTEIGKPAAIWPTWLPNGETFLRLCVFVSTEFTKVTDTKSDTAWRHRPRVFLPRMLCKRGLSLHAVCIRVHLSVCPSNAISWILSKRINISSNLFTIG